MLYYSYTHNGMKYHKTSRAAKEAATSAIREVLTSSLPFTDEMISAITWGEVVERATHTNEGTALARQDLLTWEADNPQVVDGRMRDRNDSLVLVKNIPATDLMYHELVLPIAVIWKDLAGKIQRFKQHNFEDITAAQELIFEKYGRKRGGKNGNMTFTSFDGRWKLVIAIQKQLDFGPEMAVAEEMMLECAKQLTTAVGGNADSDQAADLDALLTNAFQRIDGKLRVSSILSLRRVKLRNAMWNQAMSIIDNALIVISKKQQIRLYERNDRGAYIAIPLDIAAL